MLLCYLGGKKTTNNQSSGENMSLFSYIMTSRLSLETAANTRKLASVANTSLVIAQLHCKHKLPENVFKLAESVIFWFSQALKFNCLLDEEVL